MSKSLILSKDAHSIVHKLKELGHTYEVIDNTHQLESALEPLPDYFLIDVDTFHEEGVSIFDMMLPQLEKRLFPIALVSSEPITDALCQNYAQRGVLHYLETSWSSTVFQVRLQAILKAQQKAQRVSQNHQQLQQDLSLAAELQQSLLSEFEDIPFLESAISYIPSMGVSGDIYLNSLNAKDVANFFLGDATGHGISAALITMMAKMALSNLQSVDHTHHIMEQLNGLMEQSFPDGHFMTGIYWRVSPSGMVHLSNAGHPPAILIPANGNTPILCESSGLPLGLFQTKENVYHEQTLQLRHGDLLLIYSDGVTEVTNLESEIFGNERLLAFLKDHSTSSLDHLLEFLKEELKKFSGKDWFDDDVTMMALRYVDPHGSGDLRFHEDLKKEQELQHAIEQVQASRLFQNISNDLMQRLMVLAGVQHYQSGEIILWEGRENHCLYLIIQGKAEVVCKGEHILYLHRCGDIFGEMSIISDSPCSASVVAATPLQVICIDMKQFEGISSISSSELKSSLYQIFSVILTQKLRLTTERAEQSGSARSISKATKQVRSQFLDQVSHEFKTPLATILGNIDFLLTEPLPSSKEVIAISQDIKRAGQELLTFVNQLLELSELDSNQKLQKQRVSLQQLLQDSINISLENLPPKSIVIENQSAAIDVLLDPLKIQQALYFLIKHFTQKMQSPQLTLIAQPQEGTLEIKVMTQDPISLDALHLPSGLYPKNISQTESFRFHIEMEIIKSIVMAHDGFLETHSDSETGSEVSMVIPLVVDSTSS